MKETIISHGKTYTIIDGTIITEDNKRFDGVAHIMEASQAPKVALETVRKAKFDLTDRVWLYGAFVYRDVAEMAVKSALAKIQADKDNLTAHVPGLDLLRAAIDDEERYARQFDRMMEDENNDGARPPKPIKVSADDLRKQYPIAAAYLKAESWSCASHDVKASAGTKAVAAIAAGKDHLEAIAAMESEWSGYCDKHAFD